MRLHRRWEFAGAFHAVSQTGSCLSGRGRPQGGPAGGSGLVGAAGETAVLWAPRFALGAGRAPRCSHQCRWLLLCGHRPMCSRPVGRSQSHGQGWGRRGRALGSYRQRRWLPGGGRIRLMGPSALPRAPGRVGTPIVLKFPGRGDGAGTGDLPKESTFPREGSSASSGRAGWGPGGSLLRGSEDDDVGGGGPRAGQETAATLRGVPALCRVPDDLPAASEASRQPSWGGVLGWGLRGLERHPSSLPKLRTLGARQTQASHGQSWLKTCLRSVAKGVCSQLTTGRHLGRCTTGHVSTKSSELSSCSS